MSALWMPQAPAIWTPPKWLSAFATAGRGVVTSGGKRGVGSSGKAKVFDSSDECAECCGCTAGLDCSGAGGCTDVTPSQYQLTFSGVTLCTACDVGPSRKFRYASGFSDADINTTHTLTQSAACRWRRELTSAIIVDIYSTPPNDCTGSLFSSTTYNIEFVMDRQNVVGQEWRIAVGIAGFTPFTRIFADDQPEVSAGECATLPAFTSDLTTCFSTYLGVNLVIGTGGSATGVCL